jgi:hypothetical protein
MPILSTLRYNGSLVTWTVVSLTAAKFKPLIFSTQPLEVKVTLRFTANQFVLASSPLTPTTRDFFFNWIFAVSLHVTPSLTKGWVCLLWIWTTTPRYIAPARTAQRIPLRLLRFRGNVSTELFLSNGSFNVACLHSCYLAKGLNVKLFITVIKKGNY